MKGLIIAGNVADNPFVVDIAHHFQQEEDYSDLISLKSFTNTEFCPRFIHNEEDLDNIGCKLTGKQILIVSTSIGIHTRNDLAMRNCLIARAAKDNGAGRVILLEPDLYYSAQDRGPRVEHGVTEHKRDLMDYWKFDGQPFSARLYADILEMSGVDEVVTVHNHSYSVTNVFMDRFSGHFYNLQPSEVYADYMQTSDVVDYENLVLCAPDKGALAFVKEVQHKLGNPNIPLLIMKKERNDERSVYLDIAPDCSIDLNDVKGKDVAVIDDMVRTGNTTVECCRLIKSGQPRRVVFFITHFYSSQEVKIKLNDPAIDEIITTNTIPQILNRDMQGRLRQKMVVLKIESWVAQYLSEMLKGEPFEVSKPLYAVDMSSKNPRWKGYIGPLFSTVQ